MQEFDRVERDAVRKAPAQDTTDLVDLADGPGELQARAVGRIIERPRLRIDRQGLHPAAERREDSPLERFHLQFGRHQDPLPRRRGLAGGHRGAGFGGDVGGIDEFLGLEGGGVAIEEEGEIVALGRVAEAGPPPDVVSREAGHADRRQADQHPLGEPTGGAGRGE